MYKLMFYVPVPYVDQVKNALFAKGAGKIGRYSNCAWQVLGEGQFMPLEGSQAFIGIKDRIEKVEEYYVEMMCDEKCIHDVISALREAHPYETPAYHVLRVEDF